jgi:hypothetical protein
MSIAVTIISADSSELLSAANESIIETVNERTAVTTPRTKVTTTRTATSMPRTVATSRGF